MTPAELEAAIDADPSVGRAAVTLVEAKCKTCAVCDDGYEDCECTCAFIMDETTKADMAYLAARKAAAERLQPEPVTLREMADSLLLLSSSFTFPGDKVRVFVNEAIAYFDKTEKELQAARNLVAAIDRDGGHAQCGDLTKDGPRATDKVVALLATVEGLRTSQVAAEKELGELRQERADQDKATDRWAITVAKLSETHRLKSDELLALKKLVVAWADALDAEDAVFFRAGNTPDLYDAAQRFKKEGVG